MAAPNARTAACSLNNADERQQRSSRKTDRASPHKTGETAKASGDLCKRSSERKANKYSFAAAGVIQRASAEEPDATRSELFHAPGGRARRKTAKFPAWFRGRGGPRNRC